MIETIHTGWLQASPFRKVNEHAERGERKTSVSAREEGRASHRVSLSVEKNEKQRKLDEDIRRMYSRFDGIKDPHSSIQDPFELWKEQEEKLKEAFKHLEKMLEKVSGSEKQALQGKAAALKNSVFEELGKNHRALQKGTGSVAEKGFDEIRKKVEEFFSDLKEKIPGVDASEVAEMKKVFLETLDGAKETFLQKGGDLSLEIETREALYYSAQGNQVSLVHQTQASIALDIRV